MLDQPTRCPGCRDAATVSLLRRAIRRASAETQISGFAAFCADLRFRVETLGGPASTDPTQVEAYGCPKHRPSRTTAQSAPDAPVDESSEEFSLKSALGMIATTVCVVMALAAILGAVGSALGFYRVDTVLWGSMRPGYPEGSVVVATRQDSHRLAVGQVIIFSAPAPYSEVVTAAVAVERVQYRLDPVGELGVVLELRGPDVAADSVQLRQRLLRVVPLDRLDQRLVGGELVEVHPRRRLVGGGVLDRHVAVSRRSRVRGGAPAPWSACPGCSARAAGIRSSCECRATWGGPVR
jgi:hypothetical protein